MDELLYLMTGLLTAQFDWTSYPRPKPESMPLYPFTHHNSAICPWLRAHCIDGCVKRRTERQPMSVVISNKIASHVISASDDLADGRRCQDILVVMCT